MALCDHRDASGEGQMWHRANIHNEHCTKKRVYTMRCVNKYSFGTVYTTTAIVRGDTTMFGVCVCVCVWACGGIFNQRKRKEIMMIISLYVAWCNSYMCSTLNVMQCEFHRPCIECTDRHTVGERPQNVGFILSNSNTDVNRRDHFSYNLTVRLKSTSQTHWIIKEEWWRL